MLRNLARLVAFVFSAALVAYVVLTISSGIVTARAAGDRQPIVVRDKIAPNEHHLSGMIMVENSCDQLSVETRTLSAVEYALDFTTWRDPSVNCRQDPTPRAFRALLFAPASGIQVIATLNGAGLPIAVIPTLPEKAN